MIINFSKQNKVKIDSVCKDLKKNLSSSFTRGALRDYVVDTILTQLSQSQIKSLLVQSVSVSEVDFPTSNKTYDLESVHAE